MSESVPRGNRPVRYVREMSEIERRYAEADHETCEDGDPHSLEAHEPFDVLEGDESWATFEDRLARHGLRIVLDEVGVAGLTEERVDG